jgi:hypothetical protein
VKRSLVIAGGVLAVFAACSAFGTTSARLKQKLVGVTGLELRQCIGVPTDTSQDGASEFLTYRFAVEDERPLDADTEEKLRRRGRGGVYGGDEVPSGVDGYDPLDPNSPTIEDEMRSRRRGRPKLGYCELVFEMREGAVHGVEAEGRSSEGLNRDIDCLSRMRRCIPRDKPEPEPTSTPAKS